MKTEQKTSFRWAVLPVVLLSLSAAIAGCQEEEGDDSECKPGKAHACTCADGEEGTHECGEDEIWESCDCTGEGGAGGAGGVGGVTVFEDGTYECGGQTCPAPPELDVSGISIAGTMVEEFTLDDMEAVGIQRKPDPCCTEDDTCGLDHPQLTVDDVCREINQEGKPDPACPAEQLTYPIPLLNMDVPVTFEGCCRFNGVCGLNLTRMPLGCVDRASFASRGFEEISCNY